MDRADNWFAACGPSDGTWLREEFERITKELDQVENVRLARLDDEAGLAAYQQRAEEGLGMGGDWELTSPYTGAQYMMGCNWRERREHGERKPTHV
ncbi:MAG TPA: hypothetical protein VNL35_11945 [Chloroflexota bacterium]|nr:hypothetical protein [Chloroflexota bacterium]